jgi:hypothetical protein
MKMTRDSIKLSGRIRTNGARCLLFPVGKSGGAVMKCPGLGRTLLRDVRGIRVTNGSPMIDVACDVTGRYLDDEDVFPFEYVFGDISELIVYSEEGEPIEINIDALSQLSPSELEDCDFFSSSGRLKDAEEVRERYIRARKAW